MEMTVLLTVLSSFSMMIWTCHWVGPWRKTQTHMFRAFTDSFHCTSL